MGGLTSRRKESSLEGEEISFDHFQVLRAIGKGSFGKVCIVQKRDSKQMFAMKYMNKTQCEARDALNNVFREIEILASLNHPFLVNLWFSFQDSEDVFMVVDLLVGGDLRYHVQHGVQFSDHDVRLYVVEVASALSYLHARNIIHRDIKPDNLLLDEEGHVHLTDFNIATVLRSGQLATSMSGTKPYMAPEVFECAGETCEGYSYAVDWWSLGVTAYEVRRGKRPYDIHSNTSLHEIRHMFHQTPKFSPDCHPSLVHVLSRLLETNPEKRLSGLEEVVKIPYMATLDMDLLLQKKCRPTFTPPKDHLNCDPTFELEEMIIESRPLHKKKKRLSKQKSLRETHSSISATTEGEGVVYEGMLVFNREQQEAQKALEKREQEWQAELEQSMKMSDPTGHGCNFTGSQSGTPLRVRSGGEAPGPGGSPPSPSPLTMVTVSPSNVRARIAGSPKVKVRGSTVTIESPRSSSSLSKSSTQHLKERLRELKADRQRRGDSGSESEYSDVTQSDDLTLTGRRSPTRSPGRPQMRSASRSPGKPNRSASRSPGRPHRSTSRSPERPQRRSASRSPKPSAGRSPGKVSRKSGGRSSTEAQETSTLPQEDQETSAISQEDKEEAQETSTVPQEDKEAQETTVPQEDKEEAQENSTVSQEDKEEAQTYTVPQEDKEAQETSTVPQEDKEEAREAQETSTLPQEDREAQETSSVVQEARETSNAPQEALETSALPQEASISPALGKQPPVTSMTQETSRGAGDKVLPRPASLPPEARPASISPEARPASMSPEARPASMSPEARPASMPPEARPASMPLEARPAPMPPEASPASLPPEASPASMPPEASPASISPEARPASMPPEARRASMPPEASQDPQKSYKVRISLPPLRISSGGSSQDQTDPGPTSETRGRFARPAGHPRTIVLSNGCVASTGTSATSSETQDLEARVRERRPPALEQGRRHSMEPRRRTTQPRKRYSEGHSGSSATGRTSDSWTKSFEIRTEATEPHTNSADLRRSSSGTPKSPVEAGESPCRSVDSAGGTRGSYGSLGPADDTNMYSSPGIHTITCQGSQDSSHTHHLTEIHPEIQQSPSGSRGSTTDARDEVIETTS